MLSVRVRPTTNIANIQQNTLCKYNGYYKIYLIKHLIAYTNQDLVSNLSHSRYTGAGGAREDIYKILIRLVRGNAELKSLLVPTCK